MVKSNPSTGSVMKTAGSIRNRVVGSALIVTNRISRALAELLPPGSGDTPSDAVGGYIGAGVLALGLLAASLVVLVVIRLIREENDA
ncbi:hypothetical protein [Erythrobacter donghaensis]|uniref:hypothetical protein n=1 Tax=Erythrobacter donghaensis TaxID=267135 RepID=UPI0018C85AC0|nr:hypothetical protein [Erythrobacter donghaensis]